MAAMLMRSPLRGDPFEHQLCESFVFLALGAVLAEADHFDDHQQADRVLAIKFEAGGEVRLGVRTG
jgi:hypothetical protein